MPATNSPRRNRESAATSLLNDDVVTKLIARAATFVCQYAGGRRADRDDVQQDIRQHLVERLPAFALARGDHHRAWAKAVIVNYARTLVRRRWAKKRDPRRERRLTDELAARLLEPFDPGDVAADVGLDVESVLRLLPPHLARLAARLQREPLAPAARALGISRGRARTQLAELRAVFERAGLAAYR